MDTRLKDSVTPATPKARAAPQTKKAGGFKQKRLPIGGRKKYCNAMAKQNKNERVTYDIMPPPLPPKLNVEARAYKKCVVESVAIFLPCGPGVRGHIRERIHASQHSRSTLNWGGRGASLHIVACMLCMHLFQKRCNISSFTGLGLQCDMVDT